MIKKLALAGVLLTVFVFSVRPITDSDFWWHLAAGRYIVENQEIPHSDVFSHTNFGKAWVDHEWLSQVVFFYVYGTFGAPGIVLFKSLLVVLTFYVLYLRSRLVMGFFFSIFTLYVAASLSWNAWLERPMIFTFFFISLIMFLLDSYDKGVSDRLQLIPFIVLIWANLHGGFILGILTILIYSIGYYFAGERAKSKRLLMTSGIAVIASMVNPYTYRLLLYPFQYSYQNVHTLFIQEWQSPSFHAFGVFEAVLLGAIFIYAKTRATNLHLLISLLFTHLSLFAIRNISLFALVVTPIVLMYAEKYLLKALESSEYAKEFNMDVITKLVGKIGMRHDANERLLGLYLPAFLYAIVILAFLIPFYNYFQYGPAFDTSPQGFPEKAVEYLLQQRPEGNLFNIYGWGGYLMWNAYPEYKVFIDGRADIYGEFIYEYLNVHSLKPDWRETLQKYDVRVILMPADHPVDILLRETSEWREAYRDQMAVIYTFDGGEPFN